MHKMLLFICYLLFLTQKYFTSFKILLSLHLEKGGRNEQKKKKSIRRIQGTIVT